MGLFEIGHINSGKVEFFLYTLKCLVLLKLFMLFSNTMGIMWVLIPIFKYL